MTSWRRYVGPTKHPLRVEQVILALGPITNDPKGRWACVARLGVNRTTTVMIDEHDLLELSPAEVEALDAMAFEGGLL